MKKKLTALVAAASALAIAACGLVACGGDSTDNAELSSNTDYTKLTSAKVSATDWKNAFKTPANFSLKTEYKYGNRTDTDYYYKEGAKLHTVTDYSDKYMELKSDGTLVMVEKAEEGSGYVGAAYTSADTFYEDYKMDYDYSAKWGFEDMGAAYSSFTYKNGAYEFSQEGAGKYTVKFSGKQLAYVAREGASGGSYAYIYDYGKTKVTVPQYTDNKEPAAPANCEIEGTWYFVGDEYEIDQHIKVEITLADGSVSVKLTQPKQEGEGNDVFTGTAQRNMLGGNWTCDFGDFGTYVAQPTASDKLIVFYPEGDETKATPFYLGTSMATDQDAKDAYDQFLANWNWGEEDVQEPDLNAFAGTYFMVVDEINVNQMVSVAIAANGSAYDVTVTIDKGDDNVETHTGTGAASQTANLYTCTFSDEFGTWACKFYAGKGMICLYPAESDENDDALLAVKGKALSDEQKEIYYAWAGTGDDANSGD